MKSEKNTKEIIGASLWCAAYENEFHVPHGKWLAAVDAVRRRRRRYHTITATANGVCAAQRLRGTHSMSWLRSHKDLDSIKHLCKKLNAQTDGDALLVRSHETSLRKTSFLLLLFCSSLDLVRLNPVDAVRLVFRHCKCAAYAISWTRERARCSPDEVCRSGTWFVAVDATWVDVMGELTTFIVYTSSPSVTSGFDPIFWDFHL